MLFETKLPEYLEWLIKKLVNHDPETMIEFRERKYTPNTVPPEHHWKEGTGEVFTKLYKWIMSHGNWDKGLAELIKLHPPDYTPSADGRSHINVYTKGKTWLGKALTNLAPIGFVHPTDGKFACVEGYWYYLSTGRKHEELRELDGFAAKSKYRKAERTKLPDFEEQIKIAITCKIEQNERLKDVFTESTLPFSHYYFYGSEDNPKVIKPEGLDWIMQHLEDLRTHLRKSI